MPSPTPVAAPAGYVPEHATCFADATGSAVPVTAAAPLPVATPAHNAATSTALTGTTAASSLSVGPFTPQPGRDLRLTLSGSWTGSVQILSSIDGGTTRLPITAGGVTWGLYSANCNESVDSPSDSAATYYLQILLASGTLAYRLAQ